MVKTIENRIQSGEAICESLRNEFRTIQYSLEELNTDVNRHKDVIERMNIGILPPGYDNDAEHQRTRRFAPFAAVFFGASLTGAVGGWALSAVSEQDLSEIYARLDEQDMRITELLSTMDKIHNSLELQTEEIVKLRRLAELEAFSDVCFKQLVGFSSEVRLTFDGLYMLMHQRLHPSLVTSTALKRVLESIDKQANDRNQNIAVGTVSDLFLLPITYRFNSTLKRIQVTITIPLFSLKNRMALYEYLPTPTEQRLAIDDLRSTAYYFKPETRIIAIANDGYRRTFTDTELNQCTRIGRMFVCDQNVLYLDSQTSCIDALYSGNPRHIEERCDINIIPDQTDEVTQVDDQSFVVYLRGRTRLEFVCETHVADGSAAQTLNKGLYYVKVKVGCTAITHGDNIKYRFQPTESLGNYITLVGIPQGLDLSEPLSMLTDDSNPEIMEMLRMGRAAKLSLNRLKDRIQGSARFLTRIPTYLIYMVYGSLAAIATVFALMLTCTFVSERRISRRIGSLMAPMVHFDEQVDSLSIRSLPVHASAPPPYRPSTPHQHRRQIPNPHTAISTEALSSYVNIPREADD